jgi:hypothetical protein
MMKTLTMTILTMMILTMKILTMQILTMKILTIRTDLTILIQSLWLRRTMTLISITLKSSRLVVSISS